jgi:hypothetical protein
MQCDHGAGEQAGHPGAPVFIQSLQSLRFADFHPAVLRLPGLDRRIADADLPSQFRHFTSSLVLPQNADNLLFREPSPLHRWISFSTVAFTAADFEILNF